MHGKKGLVTEIDTTFDTFKNGGSGVWGAIPMPPNNVSDADLK
jgi:cytochrome c551/c552